MDQVAQTRVNSSHEGGSRSGETHQEILAAGHRAANNTWTLRAITAQFGCGATLDITAVDSGAGGIIVAVVARRYVQIIGGKADAFAARLCGEVFGKEGGRRGP